MNFLFDIGKVLLDFDFETSLRKLLPQSTPDADIDDRLERMLAEKDSFESGSIAVEDYIPWALEILQHDISEADFISAWQNIFTPNLPMWNAVERLHGDGHKLILFSNTNAIHCPWILDSYEIFSKFEGAVLSFEVGAIKPHDEIYHHAARKHALIPGETLYIDDLTANVETGRRLGYRTHQYDILNHDAFELWLAEQLSS